MSPTDQTTGSPGRNVAEAEGLQTTGVKRTLKKSRGLSVRRYFTVPGIHPFEKIDWEDRTASLKDMTGKVIFEQDHVEIPSFWSQTATNIVVHKYFHGMPGTPAREYSVKQLIERVTRTISDWGKQDGYFASPDDADTFYAELTHLLVNQKASFNSPVWFNVGTEKHPQCSACFINPVEDTMESILELTKTEGILFKYGSGTGTNLSPLRSSKERLSSGGKPSGPVSFMRGYDAFAGVIKSGGKTRRAAKMVLLNIDHPDIVEYITCKEYEEKKARLLIEYGYDPNDAYDSLFFQNANNSVRVSDEFMRAVDNDADWNTLAITTGEIIDHYKARDLMRMIAKSTHACGDPGLQYDSTINRWHTCPNSGRINASNPCAEFLFLDGTSCNLASLNLMRFRRSDGGFDVESFLHAVQLMIIAQEIIVDNASYPTQLIEKNSHAFRPLGLGYTNLGALLMAAGLPYDDDAGRAYAAVITALMCGQAYKTSALLAMIQGAFEGYAANQDLMLNVIRDHQKAVDEIDASQIPAELKNTARAVWADAVKFGQKSGFRNAQVTVLAPTGTISFMMDCDTTGIEPELALIKYKHLAGGGNIKMVNTTVSEALNCLGYRENEQQAILQYLETHDTIEGAPFLKDQDLAVFDCAFAPKQGKRVIHYLGHLKMMAAVQPFLSGGISKTVNVPNTITVDEITDVYMTAWKLGVKAVAIYRDGSKQLQPLTTDEKKKKQSAQEHTTQAQEDDNVEFRPARRRLPEERHAMTKKFSIAGHEGYVTVGMYADGTPGEVFIVMSKEGSTISGLMDGFATAISMALQYGVPLEVLVNKFTHMRFEPSGFTGDKNIPIAKSILDYIFRWIALKFLNPEDRPSVLPQDEKSLAVNGHTEAELQILQDAANEQRVFQEQADAPPCNVCGAIMVRNGACYKCLNCGTTSGCS
ncbi:ribonucleoside-diphosphate reductase, adenosylcobalamin-dependent [candidate division KSB3 bacterium]|uniref:Vitamin B12-dependent ribonucleotide reductase n=1 Tax=candidate division KSB3 bacterium TaxID=2044937 RepID=A0A2G6E7M5_9BACT|nr:MAG: ribonucleoside-diphosphate reductase, adenosylcobalamin-dependent [candidate division KSB3 bacterium]PIE30427.1 MAG: ribonucleoside-diphosphate reductase, adenosylcobalamin-dependent [candidate division KSB3 bacterium]